MTGEWLVCWENHSKKSGERDEELQTKAKSLDAIIF